MIFIGIAVGAIWTVGAVAAGSYCFWTGPFTVLFLAWPALLVMEVRARRRERRA